MTTAAIQNTPSDPLDFAKSCAGAIVETGLTMATYWTLTATITKIIGIAHLSLTASTFIFGIAVGLSAIVTYQIFSSYAYENQQHLVRSVVERFFYGFFLIAALPCRL
jgi:hypothetical protein